LLPEVPAGILALPGLAGMISRGWMGRRVAPQLVHPYYSDVTAGFVKRQKAYQRGINVWTVDDEAIIAELIRLGVDGIITNDVPKGLQIREKVKQGRQEEMFL